MNYQLSARVSSKEIDTYLVNLKQVLFEVTDSCNLRCKYCVYGEFYAGFDGGTNRMMPFHIAKSVIDYLLSYWNDSVRQAEKPFIGFGFYGGEPLLNFKLIERIVEYVENNVKQRIPLFSMTTNAMLLDRYMDFIAKKEFLLLISLDGDEFGDSYRVSKDGSPSFQKVFNNIKLLKEKYPDYFEKHVSFNTVLHNRNNVEAVHSFMMEEFGKTPSFSELSDAGIRDDMLPEFNKMFNSVTDSIQDAKDPSSLDNDLLGGSPNVLGLNNYIDAMSGNVFASYNDLVYEGDFIRKIPTSTCIPFQRKMFVTVDGKILQCERILHQFALGKIDENGVNIDTSKIAEDFNKGLDLMQSLCDSCFSKEVCPKCMYHIRGFENGRPTCNSYMSKEQKEAYVQFYNNYLYDHPEIFKKIWYGMFVG